MKKNRLLILTLSILCLGFSAPVVAMNTAKEAQLASEIKSRLVSGEAIELTAGTDKVLTIHEESKLPITQGGVILLHGLLQNPDFPYVMRPLRTAMTEAGYEVLAVQMPVPPMDGRGNIFPRLNLIYKQLYASAKARLDAAKQFFADKNNENLVIVAYGLGANLAVSYLTDQPSSEFRSLATISLNHYKPDNFIDTLEKLKMPTIDIYASQDIQPVVKGASQRMSAISKSAGHLKALQIRIEGSDRYYRGSQDELVSIILEWLRKTASGMEIQN